MQLHQLKPTHKSRPRRRVGRGGKRGTYSGRGVKGQKSRSGKGMRAGFAGADTPLFKRFPKIRGSNKKLKIRRGVKKSKSGYQVVNVGDLEEKFKSGSKINPDALVEMGVISKVRKVIPEVKILGSGKITKKMEIAGCALSGGAEEKIKKAGGSIRF